MKSKRDIEKELWPFISRAERLSSQNDHDTYVKFQRAFQKQLSEQLRHNPVTVSDLIFRVELTRNDIQKLFDFDIALRKKRE